MKAVHLGLRRRQSPALLSTFFDQDMPAEWRVAFLLNEQDALWVAGVDTDTDRVVAELAEAASPVFVVVEAAAWSPAWERVARRGDHHLRCLGPDTPIWRPTDEGREADIGLVPASADPVELRDWLNRFTQQAPTPAALFVDGDPPSVATVDRLRTLCELMGL
ncbi:MAG: hypothetical protein JXJ30_06260 [Halothiobacillaceae bacterium]|nr:hypothetical protein [Halothiobacillaceae bacterium]